MGVGTARSLWRGQQAESRLISSDRIGGHHQAAPCGDVGSTFAIGLNPAISVYSTGARQSQILEALPAQAVEPRPAARQQTPVRRFAQTYDYLAGETLGRPVTPEALAIVAEHAVFRGSP